MIRHDESLMWEYAARELPSEDARLVQHHLTECPDCQEKLTDVRTARGALAAAREQVLELSYAKADAALAKVIEKRMEKSAFGRSWVVAFSGALVAAGVALVAYGYVSRPRPMASPTMAVAVAKPKTTPSVEKATGLTVIGAQSRLVPAGSPLASGDVLRTGDKGEATLKLPEGTKLKLAQSSQLSLTRAEADDVTLALEHGHVAVAASHARRKGFVVHTSGMMVTVVGTTFSVTSSRDGVEVAVGEGKVSVEPPVGLPRFVSAGQRVRFDSKWRSTQLPLTVAQKKELAGLTEVAVVTPAPGGKVQAAPRSEPELPALPAPAPAPAPKPVQVAAAAPAVAPSPPAPPSKPDMSGLEIPLLASPVESVGPAKADEWAPMPAPVSESTKAAKLGLEESTAGEIFMQRAELSMTNGTCQRHLPGLGEIAEDLKNPAAEKARIMRARCFDALMKVREMDTEYARYLRDFPHGAFAAEARTMTADK